MTSGVLVITLDGNKRFQTLNITETRTSKEGIRTYNETITYQYSANPQLPAGFTKNQFTRIPQYSVNINWGAGIGTKKYWSDEVYDDKYAYFYLGDSNAPVVAGKVPEFYTDLALKNKITSVHYYEYDGKYQWSFNYELTAETNGTTIYAKWVDPSTVINSNAPAKSSANVEKNGFFGIGKKLF
ncbi:hypothetical protein FACS189463_3890 [Bacteroidia bacterium]|nr:hypothetical protein FACS189463_3890 [Bacteroidia bacterium]